MKNWITILGILGLIFLTGSSYGQTSSPYDVVYNHLWNLDPAHRDVHKSAESFHPDFPLDRRVELAENLKQILDARGYYITVSKIPKNTNYRDSVTGNFVYSLVREIPQFTIEKYGNHWYYSKSLDKDIPAVFKKTFPSWSLNIINKIPESLKIHILQIPLWKYFGFVAIILIAYILYRLFRVIILKLLEKVVWRRLNLKNTHLSLLKIFARNIGLILFIQIIMQLLPLLMLEISVSNPLFRLLNIIVTIVLMVTLFSAVDIVDKYVRNLASSTDNKTDDQLIPILIKSAKVIIAILSALRVLYLLDVNVTALIAGVSIGGLALALAAQDTVKNLIGSAMIFFDRPFQVGDYIQAMNFEGTVEEVGFRSSRIRKTDTSLITVPNGNLTNASMVNYGIRKFRLFETNLGFTYQSSIDNLQKFSSDLKNHLEQHSCIKNDYYVFVRHLSASSIDVFFRVFIDAPSFREELEIREKLIFTIIQLADQNSLDFAFPSSSLYVEKLPKKN